MLKYRLCIAHGLFDLSMTVNEYMLTGWKPQGSPYYDVKIEKHVQAMIKEIPEAKNA